MTSKKGFTLIELLVVIGIIGVLATISVTSLQSAQKRARDTKRITIVKGMATMIEGEDAGTPGTKIVCAAGADCAAGGLTDTVTGPSTLGGTGFKDSTDPQTPTVGCNATRTAACKFAISKKDGSAGVPLTNDYAICFYLEAGGAGRQAGMNSIKTGAVFDSGCPF